MPIPALNTARPTACTSVDLMVGRMVERAVERAAGVVAGQSAGGSRRAVVCPLVCPLGGSSPGPASTLARRSAVRRVPRRPLIGRAGRALVCRKVVRGPAETPVSRATPAATPEVMSEVVVVSGEVGAGPPARPGTAGATEAPGTLPTSLGR